MASPVCPPYSSKIDEQQRLAGFAATKLFNSTVEHVIKIWKNKNKKKILRKCITKYTCGVIPCKICVGNTAFLFTQPKIQSCKKERLLQQCPLDRQDQSEDAG